MGGLSARSIEPAEKLEWSWEKARTGVIGGLIVGLISGLGGLIFGLLMFGAIMNGPVLRPVLGQDVGQVVGLILALFVGLILGLIVGLSVVLTRGLRATKIELTALPNRGIWNSARNALVIMLSAGLIIGLMGGLILGLIGGLLVGLMGGLVLGLQGGLILGLMGGLVFGPFWGLRFGGGAVIQHFTLRFLLSRSGCLPWNLVRFLDYAAERIFLRKVGGGYIFVHRTLMEYFASLNQLQVKP